LEVGFSFEWWDWFMMRIVVLNGLPYRSGRCILKLLDAIGRFGVTYHCVPFMAFVLAIFMVCRGRFQPGSSIGSFNTLLCQREAVGPPGCFRFPWLPCGDSFINCLLDELGDVGDGTEGIIGSLKLRKVHFCGMDFGIEDPPICLVPTSTGGNWYHG
jgi:hypothetical protein